MPIIVGFPEMIHFSGGTGKMSDTRVYWLALLEGQGSQVKEQTATCVGSLL